ncbi:unnamed protein product [Darwinula stevensoni]|uniref:Rho-GAP domain-containing protein n=1 Tax=Darwinula stevensoni TaxID=69355 RepID=A0A7R9A6C1_9CRUS|nr:unnamed protein product [Darwinula stevensoni]CAG0887320.1 unnamed protein product [Darwinula stevensoni]
MRDAAVSSTPTEARDSRWNFGDSRLLWNAPGGDHLSCLGFNQFAAAGENRTRLRHLAQGFARVKRRGSEEGIRFAVGFVVGLALGFAVGFVVGLALGFAMDDVSEIVLCVISKDGKAMVRSLRIDDRPVGSGIVFGIPLKRCLENDRRKRIAAASPFRESNESRCSKLSESDAGSYEEGGGSESQDGGPEVPLLVSVCLKHLEANGLHTLGIFRVSSSRKRVRQLREDFDGGAEVALDETQCPHDVATLLKEFLRDLPEPLLTKDLYKPFIATQKLNHRSDQVKAMRLLVSLLPPSNRDTLWVLLNFLANVAANAEDHRTRTGDWVTGNKMDSNNLATVMTPNILPTPESLAKKGQPLTSVSGAMNAAERCDAINTVNQMIQLNKELFVVRPRVQHRLVHEGPRECGIYEFRVTVGLKKLQAGEKTLVPTSLLDQVCLRLLEKEPAALEYIMRKKAGILDEIEIDLDTSSSQMEASGELVAYHRLAELDLNRTSSSGDVDGRRYMKREEILHEGAGTGGRRVSRSSEDTSTTSTSGWFRKREKSSSRELGPECDQNPQQSKGNWFRRGHRRRERERSKTQGDIQFAFPGPDSDLKNGEPTKSPSEGEIYDPHSQVRPLLLGWELERERDLRLAVPEQDISRRMSSPDGGTSAAIITASLRIPVPLSRQHASAYTLEDHDIPFIEDEVRVGSLKDVPVFTPLQKSASAIAPQMQSRDSAFSTGSSDSAIRGASSEVSTPSSPEAPMRRDSLSKSATLGSFVVSVKPGGIEVTPTPRKGQERRTSASADNTPAKSSRSRSSRRDSAGRGRRPSADGSSSSTGSTASASGKWKRWEIIASDPKSRKSHA